MKTQLINFAASATEHRLIDKIVDRAVATAKEHGAKYDRMTAEMDILATHLNGCPLDLEKLLNAENFDFAHDVFGIRRHLNRNNGQLENCFLPRCFDSSAIKGA